MKKLNIIFAALPITLVILTAVICQLLFIESKEANGVNNVTLMINIVASFLLFFSVNTFVWSIGKCSSLLNTEPKIIVDIGGKIFTTLTVILLTSYLALAFGLSTKYLKIDYHEAFMYQNIDFGTLIANLWIFLIIKQKIKR